jgi:hypothetical protein
MRYSLILSALVGSSLASDVVDLTKDTFEAHVKDNALTLIECKH